MFQSFSQTSLYRFLQFFVTPPILPSDVNELLRLKLILAYLLMLVGAGTANFLIWWLTNLVDFTTLFLFLGFGSLYLLGRFLRPQWGIRGLVIFLFTVPYLRFLIEPQSLDILFVMFVGFLALLTTSLFNGFRMSLVAAAFNIATIFSLNQVLSQGNSFEALGILIPVMVLTVLLIFTAYVQQSKLSTSHSYDYYPEAVIIQLDNQIIYANARAARLLGAEKAENLLGQLVVEHLPVSSSHYHVANDEGRITLSYKEKLSQQNKYVQIQATTIPYNNTLANLIILKELVSDDLDSEEKSFRTLSRLMSDYAYSLEVLPDNQLKFLWVAGAVEVITGRSEAEIMALAGWESILHPDDRAFFRIRHKALLLGESRSLEYRIMRPDGTICWVQDNASPIRDSHDGRVYRIHGETHDISERIKAQEILRAHVVQQAVVAELGLLALSVTEVEHLLSHAAVLCEQVLDAQLAVIFEYDKDANVLICRSSSRPDEVMVVGKRVDTAPQSSLLAYTLFAQEAVVSMDLSQEQRFQALPEMVNVGYKSAMCVIILGQAAPYGVMCVYSEKQQNYDEDEVYFLQSVANVLGTFIERHRAQISEREEREFAEALRDATLMINSRLDLHDVLNKILAYLPLVVPSVESASIMLYIEADNLYHFVNTWGFSPEATAVIQAQYYPRERFPLLERMIESKSPLIIPDINAEPLWFRTNDDEVVLSYLGAPIIAHGNCIGFLHLNSKRLNAFSEKDASRVQSFADKTGNAIINARRADELESLVKVRTEELQKQREQLATILNSSGEGIFYVEDGKIIFANQSLCEMTGYALEELTRQDANLFLPDDLSVEEAERLNQMEMQIRKGQVSRLETRFMRRDKQSFAVGITSSALQSKDGIFRKVSIIRDISQEKELAQLKNRFIANAAHDLRSPITSLKMRMYMIEKHPQQLPEHLEKLDQIINRMNRLVGDLLDSASIGQGSAVIRPESSILQTVLQRVVEILQPEAEQAKLSLSLEMPEAPLHVWADTVRLEQVFTNLITNAIHYTETGSVRVLCAMVEKKARIKVIDTGMGIPSEALELIFQPFYRVSQTAHIQGTGLGLSITREIIEKHGGTITVSSELGKGTCFEINLPLLEES